ncbi:MATE family efflux transporter [Oscillibacter valericigenes]|uniref:MATE family efflux transporter n=1 Tax=Oscillibacter valericigenes TaxID=351091 RepID=UPI001F2E4B79|nr:MATE family efflux transporter [Oscillibacter valericigenes]MCF2618051.1 MATE family efflux transporter [Oscillibacter valericigenes]
MEREHDFTRGPILSSLLRFALPVLLALLLQAMYGAVDLQVVGKFGTAADISAVSTGSQIMQTITIVITGLAMGVTVLLGQKIGEGRPAEAGRVVGSGICLFGAVALLVTAVMLLAAPGMSALMQAPADAFDGTVVYVRICSVGAVFIVAYNILGSIFRGLGDSKMPLLTVAIACVCNIAGDLLLVGGMGVAGAAIATVSAQAVSVALSLLIIRRRKLPFTLTRADIRFDKAVIGKILKLGSPVALQDLLVSLSFLAIIAIANAMGTIASAGVGVAEKLCAFVMLVPSAYMQSMSAFVAQNIGAGREDRARRALLCGILSSFAAGLLMGWAAFFHGDVLAGLFAEDGAVIAAVWEYLKAYAIDCLLTSFLFCFIGYFNGCGRTVFVMVQGFVGALGVRLPVAFLMSRVSPGSLFHLGLSTPASTVVQILLCAGVFFYFGRKREKSSISA